MNSLPPRQVAVQTSIPDSAKPAVEPLRFSCTCDPISIQTTTWQPPASLTIQPLLTRVAGVQVTPYSGAPGAWSTVRIRGIANVTGSRQPLYVVDGLPAYNTDVTPELWTSVHDFYRSNLNGGLDRTPHAPNANPLLDLAVDDIATVEVLKGAAATARYGMQGSNGVILISTRQGADGRAAPQPLRVRYTGWAGVQQVRQRYQLLNARQYADLTNAAALNSGNPPPYAAADFASLGENNWQDQAFRTAGVQSHNLSLDGLARHTRYLVAANYLQQTGVVQGSSLSRYQLRLNLDQQLIEKLSVGLRASASQTDQRYAGTDFDGGPLLQGLLLGIPAVPARNASTSNASLLPNPRQELDYYYSTPRTRRLLVQLQATYQFSPALQLTVRGRREQAEARELSYSPDKLPPAQLLVVGSGTATTSVQNWVVDATLRYQRTWADQHVLAAALTYLRQQYRRTLENRTQTSYSSSGFGYAERQSAIHSPSLSGTYTYAGRYEVQASLRSEVVLGSGGATSDYRLFPGGQLSWHAHRETFLADVAGLSELTLWAGVGQTSTFFSADRTTHHDAGLRLGLLGGHLTLEASTYQRRTRHAQTVVPIALLTSGGITYTQLFPDVKLLNRGLELAIGSTWQWGTLVGSTQLAAATNRHEVEDITPDYLFGPRVNGLEKGQPLARAFVLEQQGTYPASSSRAGEARFADRNGDGIIGYGDGYYAGSGLPRYTLNLFQQLRRNRFQLEAQLDGLFGYQLLNPTLVELDVPSGYANSSVRALDYWNPDHQNTSVPAPGSYPSPYLSNQALASGSHLRLSQLSLAYELVKQPSRKVSVWVGGQNLFVTGNYRGFDPNVSGGGASPLLAGRDASVYPVARVWQLGVRGEF